MCYLIAKCKNTHGCYALKTSHGPELVALKKELNDRYMKCGIQFVTISRPTAYGEYAPYRFAKDNQQFKELVGTMVS